jgi:hypothetical protein
MVAMVARDERVFGDKTDVVDVVEPKGRGNTVGG